MLLDSFTVEINGTNCNCSIGDFIDCFMALMLVKSAQKIDGGLPPTLRAKMMFNIALDFGLGLIPILGDIADAVFRANTRNAWLLEVYLTKRMEAQRVGHVSDPELGTIKVPPGNQQVQNHQGAIHQGEHQQQGVTINQPEPARVHAGPRPVRSQPGSRFGVPINTNGKIRRPDAEMAMAAVDYGVRAMNSRSELLAGNDGAGNGRRNQKPNGSSTPRTKEDLAVAALKYGARAALDAHSNLSKSGGR